MGGQPRTDVAAKNGGGRQAEGNFPVEVSKVEMFISAHQRSRNDHCEGRSDRNFDIHLEEENHCGNHDTAAADAKQAAGDSADNPDKSRCRTEIRSTLAEPFTDHPRMLFAESLPANQIHSPTKVEH